MAFSEGSIDRRGLQEALRRERVFYQAFLELAWQPTDALFSWFEIALHVKTEECHPPNDHRNRDQLSTLMELAGFLVQQIRFHAPYQVALSTSYHTLHPPRDTDAPMLFRSISLVFVHVSPYNRDEEPAILAELKSSLGFLDIPRI
jgi:hypothetical protein